MKTYKVYASQEIFYAKIVEAENEDEALQKAWEDDNGDDWKDVAYGEWKLEEDALEVLEAQS